jgi:hypothetical protein
MSYQRNKLHIVIHSGINNKNFYVSEFYAINQRIKRMNIYKPSIDKAIQSIIYIHPLPA